MPLAHRVDINGEREPLPFRIGYDEAVGLLIHIVAPTADCLTHQKNGHANVGQSAEFDFVFSAKQPAAQKSADYAAEYRDASFPYCKKIYEAVFGRRGADAAVFYPFFYADGFYREILGPDDNVHQPCKNDGQRYDIQKQSYHIVRLDLLLFPQQNYAHKPQNHGGSKDKAVPLHGKPAYGESHVVRSRKQIT